LRDQKTTFFEFDNKNKKLLITFETHYKVHLKTFSQLQLFQEAL